VPGSLPEGDPDPDHEHRPDESRAGSVPARAIQSDCEYHVSPTTVSAQGAALSKGKGLTQVRERAFR
jgi:hypothetical protein